MDEEITFYTPATGLPDLEAKIAFGLARIGIEAYGSESVEIEPLNGFYKIKAFGAKDELEKAFNLLAQRILSSNYLLNQTPGITSGSANKLSFKADEKASLELYIDLPNYLSENLKSEPICRHQERGLQKVSAVIGLASATSYHHARDLINIQVDRYGIHRPTNPKYICKVCSMLALLGIWFSTFVFSIGKNREVFVVVVPLPKRKISGVELLYLLSIQHHTRKDRIKSDIPQNLLPLAFLSRIPSSADFLRKFDLFFAVLSKQRVYHVDALFKIHLDDYISYISANSYNVSTIDLLIRKAALSAFSVLNELIVFKRRADISKFARLYSQETSAENYFNLLYPETSRYLLKEVGMIRQEIIENQAIASLARTLRYFVRERKYQYVDNIRNARKDSKDFEETIAMMLREGRLRLEQNEKIHLPTEKEVREVFGLANESFDETKTALAILAFTFPTKKDEEVEIMEEVPND